MTRHRTFPAALTAAIALLAVAAAPATAAEPSWLAPHTLSDSEAGGQYPAIAAAPNGSVVALWFSNDGGTDRVAASIRRAGSSEWSEKTFISPPENGDVSQYGIGVIADSDNNFTASWLKADFSVYYGSILVAGAPSWSAPEIIGEPGEAITGGAVAARPNGTVLWMTNSYVSGNRYTRFRVRQKGSLEFSAPVDIPQPDFHNDRADLAINASGDAIATWVAQTSGAPEMRSARYTAATDSWSAPSVVASSAAGFEFAAVALNDAGAAVAIWLATDGSSAQLAFLDAGSNAWDAPDQLLDSGYGGLLTDVAADADGDFIAVWQDYLLSDPYTTARVGSRHFEADTGAWGAVNHPFGDAGVGAPRFAANADKDLALSMMGERNSAIAPFAATWSSEEDSFSERQPLGDGPLVLGGSVPSAAVDGLGNVLVGYTVNPGGVNKPTVVAGDGSGPALGGLSVPSTAVAGQPVSMSVSPTDIWSAIASTSWDLGDGASKSGSEISHTFAGPGTYSVTVTSTDAVGHSTSSTRTVIVSAPPAADEPDEGDDDGDKPVVLPPVLEARLSGKTVTLNARVTLKARKRCSGNATATTAFGGRTYRTTLKLRTVGGKCRATGKIKLRKTPSLRTKLRITISGKQIKTRTLTSKRG